MKKLIILSLMIGLAILFILAGKSFAQTSSSVTVSFSIPAMPGLNSPLIEEEKVVKIQPQEETKNPASELIQTEKQEEKIVKTFYSR